MPISPADNQRDGFGRGSDAPHDNAQRRAVEALAQALYEAEDPAGIAWAKRTRIVRDPWLLRAQRQLRSAQEPQ
jgi:hypothetical protein